MAVELRQSTPQDTEQTFQGARQVAFAVAYRILGDPIRAEDTAQETAERLWIGRESIFFPTINSLAAVAARNKAIDSTRDAARRDRFFTSLATAPEIPSDHDTDPEKSCVRTETEQQVHQVLATLSPEYRTALVLFGVFGFSCEQIGGVTNSSRQAVKSRLMRAREKFKAEYARINDN